jgi:4-amino-4-deoxy-L-arabinose transferase-like glycosyltransferase
MSSRPTRLRELLLLGGLCGFFFFFRLSAIGLLGPDEPRYAQVAREMLARGDWVTPVLYHHTWLEKPILLYWGEMLAYSAFGVSDWAARLPSALAATLLVCGTFLAVRRIRYAARLDAALMIASSVLILGFARAAATDMLLASPWCLSLLAWFAWYEAQVPVPHICPVPAPSSECHPEHSEGPQQSPNLQRHSQLFNQPSIPQSSPVPAPSSECHPERSEGPQQNPNLQRHSQLFNQPSIPQSSPVPVTDQAQVPHICPPSANVGTSARPYLFAFYALNALATLAKGPVAPVLAAFVLLAFCASQRNLRAVVRTLDPLGLAVFVAIAAPWYVLVQLRTPEFFRIFFLQHNLARFGSNLYRHRQPFWYYLPVALIATLPWTVWLFHGLADAFCALRSNPKGAPYLPSFGKCGNPTAPNAIPAFTFEVFLFLWALVPIAFFSISRSKLPGYILPSIPALLILAAVAVHRRAARNQSPRWTSIAAHAVLLAALAAAGCVAPRLAFKLPLSPASLLLAAFAGTAIFLLIALPLLASGWRLLHFVTLLPVILAVGFLLRGLAPALDATQSARPIAALLQQAAALPPSGQPGALPVATFALNRNLAFGLAFYLNRRVDPYEGLEISPAVYELPPAIPASAHLLVARDGSLPALRLLLSGRSLQLLAAYPPQHIEIFQVSPSLSPAP